MTQEPLDKKMYNNCLGLDIGAEIYLEDDVKQAIQEAQKELKKHVGMWCNMQDFQVKEQIDKIFKDKFGGLIK